MGARTFTALLKEDAYFMARQLRRHGMGWLPDYPDIRDYTARHAKIAPLLERTRGALPAAERALPSAVDLREWCSPIEDQGALGSCTAQAGAGLVEYFEKRAFGKYIDASRLFLYKVTRNLLHWTGDRGAFIRTTMGAIVLFGLPPEEYWPYVAEVYDNEPPAFCYAFAHNYQGISYFRLDPPGTSANTLLEEVKSNLAAGVPAMFGFTVYSSIAQAETTAGSHIPPPARASWEGTPWSRSATMMA